MYVQLGIQLEGCNFIVRARFTLYTKGHSRGIRDMVVSKNSSHFGSSTARQLIRRQ